MPADDLMSHVVERAMADVGQRRKVPVAELTVVNAEDAPLREASLQWCRDRGVEVDDPAFLVVVRHDDRAWVYLAGGDAVPVLCPTDEADGGTGFVPPPGFDE